jgi:3'-phosphoadenosine 5'-phosphosulfate sulfotransferase (PAPS reductase)/FAD synthetase
VPQSHKLAFELIRANETFSAISRATGLTIPEIMEIKRRFEKKMRDDHFMKFKAGTFQDETGDWIIPLGRKHLSDQEAEESFNRWLESLGLVPDAEQGIKR